jgi:general secretion pathway protein C
LLSSVFYFILPKDGVEFKTKQDIVLEYRKFNIYNFLSVKKIIQKPKPKKKIEVKKPEYKFLDNVTLKAIYAMQGQLGWIVLANKNNITYVLSTNEEYKGYKLVRVYAHYVIFSKDNQEYKLVLNNTKKVDYTITKQDTKSKNKNDKIKIVVSDDKTTIKRSYLNSYINDLDKIWQDISIVENRDKQGHIDGFKVDNINTNSVFSKLGLKRYDIIKAVNNTRLKSYNDAFSIYKKINKITNLNMLILRNGREMELEYEIK